MNSSQPDFWKLQSPGEPLYGDLIWSQPQHSLQAGKLLIIGGNIHGFSAPAKAYERSTKAGAGSIRVLLPDSLRSTIKTVLPQADYCPSTPSGSFSKRALAELIDHASWSDATLVAGDLGRNSETAMLLETFCSDYKGKLVLTKDSVDYFVNNPSVIMERPDTLIVLTVAQLQKISLKVHADNLITFNMSLLKMVESLHNISLKSSVAIITKHEDNLVIAYRGMVSTTKLKGEILTWRVEASSFASVWWLQNPNKVFEALTTSMHLYLESL